MLMMPGAEFDQSVGRTAMHALGSQAGRWKQEFEGSPADADDARPCGRYIRQITRVELLCVRWVHRPGRWAREFEGKSS